MSDRGAAPRLRVHLVTQMLRAESSPTWRRLLSGDTSRCRSGEREPAEVGRDQRGSGCCPMSAREDCWASNLLLLRYVEAK